MVSPHDGKHTHQGGSFRRSWVLATLACILSAVLLVSMTQAAKPSASAPAPDIQALMKEYQERLESLGSGDVQGHYALAEWCRDRKLYSPLLQQAQHVLRLDPGHENARLLYRLAVDQLKAQASQTRPADTRPSPIDDEGEFLTPAQIHKLKWAEFLDPTSPVGIAGGRGRSTIGARTRPGGITAEFLQVRYDGRVLGEFFELMSGNPGFSSREDRARLLKYPPTYQVQLIRGNSTAGRFENRIEIINDPLVFRQFQKVLPLVASTCGTLTCHGGPDAQAWRLRTSRTKSDLNLYTNFLILNRVRRGNQRLVNREKPEESLLIQFSLPQVQALYPHPEPIPTVFPKGRDDVRYRTVLSWIQTLRVPEPKTGVTLPGYPEPPPPQFGGVAKNQNEPAAKDKGEPPVGKP